MSDPSSSQIADRTYGFAAARSRSGRQASHDTLTILEAALSAPTPNRQTEWRDEVVAALDAFIVAIDEQARADQADTSLLSEIANDQPRLRPRILRLHAEHRDRRDTASSLRAQIAGGAGAHSEDAAEAVDTADIRDRLAALALQYRRHRARETDLVYEAINLDLGAGD